MSARFVSVDRNQPLLLPVDLREWVPEDDLVHFVIEAVSLLPESAFRVNVKGTGSAQYPPSMMLSLLIYCYANGVFSSRRIERATHRDIAVRYLTADTHPDHDTIATFRRENFDVVSACFVRVLELAREMKLLKVGTVSVDGTTLKANASKRRNVSGKRAGELVAQLEAEVQELMERAERSDRDEASDGQSLPGELGGRQALKAQLEAAQQRLKEQAERQVAAERAEYERKLKERKQRGGKHKGRPPKEPKDTAAQRLAKLHENLTDPDSRLQRHNERSPFEQSYNAQAVVDADGSQLVVGARVSQGANDKEELVPDMASIPASLGTPHTVLADAGYLSETQIRTLEGDDEAPRINVLVSVHAEAKGQRQKYDLSPLPDDTGKKPRAVRSDFVRQMSEKMQLDESRSLYRLRKQTVEPVFGIIKETLGFTQFHLRGLDNVNGEWDLVTLAYNLKRLWNLAREQKQRAKQGPRPKNRLWPAITQLRAGKIQALCGCS